MNSEAYARGFVKTANAHGVDPVSLAKYAADQRTMVSNSLGEAFSPVTNLFVGRLVGSVAGSLIAKSMGRDTDSGFRTGKMVGALVPAAGALVGSIAAAITRRRTNKEQEKHDKKRTWLSSMLVPGVGMYNYFKRQGALENKSE